MYPQTFLITIKKLARMGLLPLVLALFLSGCLLDPQFLSETQVFSAEEAVIPAGISDSYGLDDGPDGSGGFVQFTKLDGSLFAAEMFIGGKKKDGTKEWEVHQHEGFFVTLSDDWYVFVQNRQDGRQGFTIVGVEDGTLTFVPTLKTDKAEIERIARTRGLQLTDSVNLAGSPPREALLAFLNDIRLLAQVNAAPLPAVAAIPYEIQEAAYATTGPKRDDLDASKLKGNLSIPGYVALLRDADSRGISWGSYWLARLYANGAGVPLDHLKARQHAERAVERGLERAHAILGFLALYGINEPKDENKAAMHYQEAAEAGEPRAWRILGTMYLNGQGVAQDKGQAAHWLRLAADKGDATAQNNYGTLLEPDYRSAADWYRKAAEQGLSAAQYNLGVLYETGRGVPADRAKTQEWYRLAAKQGHKPAQERLDALDSPQSGVTAGEVIAGAIIIGLAAAILSGDGGGSDGEDDGGSGAFVQSAPPCGQDYWIEPGKMPCGKQWRAQGEWPQDFWCYTDYNMQINGSRGVTYCTNGAGVWEMSGITHPCNGAEGWCDNYGMGPREGFWQ